MHTAVEVVTIKDRLDTLNKRTGYLDPFLVDLFELIDDKNLITHEMLDSVLSIPPTYARYLYCIMNFISIKTNLWHNVSIPHLFKTLTKHKQLSILNECFIF